MTTNPADDKKKFTAVPNRHTGPVSKVLIANRGEIAVRVIRDARDEGIETVAIYAEPDRDAQHVKLADEAYALNGATAGTSYLVMEKVLEIAIRAGADAVHPGYGFLSENAQFAQMVIDAGLTWIGPSPESITQLGDKVAARHIAQKVGAPLVPGTKDPVESADEVLKFADEFGLPIAIKAAFGGGGRGLKVVRDRNDVIELYESAVREAVAAYGRGECFIERFLDSPRHVETQCLADAHGNVQVVSTRDCSLQRRNQKLIEEAPAPFLSEEQTQRLYEASRAILTEAGYQGAGTCEFLLAPDGTISFLEVNTRLQVEHPVSEEVAGIDLVREQFRIARGEQISPDSPQLRGHSIEFRINGEDAGRSFMPAPGNVDDDEAQRQSVVVEVNGKRLEVVLPDLGAASGKSAAKTSTKPRKSRSSRAGGAAGGNDLTSPMQGTIVKVAVADGDTVAEGDLVLVLEAMKMEQPITAHKAGKVSGLSLKAGDTVTAGQVLATIK